MNELDNREALLAKIASMEAAHHRKMEEARQWNQFIELQLKNLQTINDGLEQDLQTSKLELEEERNPNCDGSLAFHLSESNQRENELRSTLVEKESAHQREMGQKSLTCSEMESALRSQLAEKERQVSSLEAGLQDFQSIPSAFEAENKDLKATLESAIERVNVFEMKLAEKGAECKEWKAEQKRLIVQRDALRKQAEEAKSANKEMGDALEKMAKILGVIGPAKEIVIALESRIRTYRPHVGDPASM